MVDREKVITGLECCSVKQSCSGCPWMGIDCNDRLHLAVLELLREQNEIIDALLKVGYPHNFQREPPWIVNYMCSITDVITKAVHLRNGEVKQDGVR